MQDHDLQKQAGVFVSTKTLKKFKDFEESYLAVRSKEQRILSIEQIKKLPEVPKDYIHFKEWEIRKKNIYRFLKYLEKKPRGLRILDIGCGNGFFTHLMSKNNKIVAVDVNLTELKQAAEAFPTGQITWYYLDIMNEIPPEGKYDIIVFCASFQYFDRPEELLQRCQEILYAQGEIHIIDSPFYNEETKKTARLNSKAYYKNMEVESMINHYHHNTYEVLKKYSYTFKYKPGRLLNRLFRKSDSPFAWLMLPKISN